MVAAVSYGPGLPLLEEVRVPKLLIASIICEKRMSIFASVAVIFASVAADASALAAKPPDQTTNYSSEHEARI